MKRNFLTGGETTVEGAVLQRRCRGRTGKVCEDGCKTAAAFRYRTYVDTARAKRETV